MTLLGMMAACGGDSESAAKAAQSPSGAVVSMGSSIHSGDVLSEPLVWQATVGPAGVVVDRVDFLIDGRTRWSEQFSPYEFNEGRLFAPWLVGPGLHTLAVRAMSADRPVAQASAKVTVRAQPHRLPLGTYRRTVTKADTQRVAGYRDAAHGAFGEFPETGDWVLQVRPQGLLSLNVAGPTQYDAFFEPYRTQGNSLTVYDPAVWLQPHPDDGSMFCEPERPASYTWSSHSDRLTITPTRHACADRDMILVGTWRH